jgi:hypothetical protein
MPKGYVRTYEEEQQIVDKVCDIIRNGNSLRKACKELKINCDQFYKYIDNDETGQRKEQYTRATDERVEVMADEILEISDDSSRDTISTEKGDIPDNEWINRSRLRVDARKWLMSKMRPSKYGDKLDITSKDEKIQQSVIVLPSNGRDNIDKGNSSAQ